MKKAAVIKTAAAAVLLIPVSAKRNSKFDQRGCRSYD
jgi:hypothetical protein